MSGEELAIGCAGELGSAIRVKGEVLGVATLIKRHAQSDHGQWSVEDGTHGPADHASTKHIQDRDEIEPALAGEYASGVGDPDLVWSLYR